MTIRSDQFWFSGYILFSGIRTGNDKSNNANGILCQYGAIVTTYQTQILCEMQMVGRVAKNKDTVYKSTRDITILAWLGLANLKQV